MRTWFTGKPCEYTERSHINFCVYDSTWEAKVKVKSKKAKRGKAVIVERGSCS